MHIAVRCDSSIGNTILPAEQKIEIPPASTVDTLLTILGITPEQKQNILILINQKPGKTSSPLAEGDRVMLLTPSMGG